ncbi:MAG: type II toxin-antitoxin system RelE/ParE family toxin, partial [Egibacteraceae bacterium]
MGYQVEYTDEFEAWWVTLTVAQQEDFDAVVRLLEAQGPTLGRPHVDRIQGSRLHNLKELRCNSERAHMRALFVFDARRTAVLLLGGDKSGAWQAWYRQAIPRAEQLYERYLAELRDEGL